MDFVEFVIYDVGGDVFFGVFFVGFGFMYCFFEYSFVGFLDFIDVEVDMGIMFF